MPGPGRFRTLSAALLAGGGSDPRAADPAHLAVGGVACATRIARELDPLFEDLLLVGGDPPGDAPGRRVPDRPGPACALRGLVTALEESEGERVLVVSARLPLLRAELALALIAWPEADVVLPCTDEGPRPDCALYRRTAALRIARHHLEAGRLALSELLGALETSELGPEELARVDPEAASLTRVATPEQAARAESLAAGDD